MPSTARFATTRTAAGRAPGGGKVWDADTGSWKAAAAAAARARAPLKEESSLRRGARFSGRALLGAALALAGAGGVAVSRDEQLRKGLHRGYVFWWNCFPMYLHYRYVQWTFRNKDVDTPGPDKDAHDAAFNTLHDRYAPEAERLCLQLRGFYLKHAQLCSTLDYFVPPQYLVWCKRMQPVNFLQNTFSDRTHCICTATARVLIPAECSAVS